MRPSKWHPGAAAGRRRPGLRACCSPWRALGLSMIFGTTGLTNFAHGELITFGALVGLRRRLAARHVHIGAQLTVTVAVVFATIASGGVRLGPGPAAVAAAAPPGHRPDRDDDRQHRPVDPAAQRLPVLRRRPAATTTPSTPAPSRTASGTILITPQDIFVVLFSRRGAGLGHPGAAAHPARQGDPGGRGQPGPRRASGINVDRVIPWSGSSAPASPGSPACCSG